MAAYEAIRRNAGSKHLYRFIIKLSSELKQDGLDEIEFVNIMEEKRLRVRTLYEEVALV